MKKYLILNDNNIITDIITSDCDNISEEPYFLYINPTAKKIELTNENDNFPWKTDIPIADQLLKYIDFKNQQFNEQNEKYLELKEQCSNLEERLKLIEDLLIEELLFSPTFGKERNCINVQFQQQ